MRIKPHRILKRPCSEPSHAKSSLGVALFGKTDEGQLGPGPVLLVVPRIGQVRHLPRGYETADCSHCGSAVWVNRSFMNTARRQAMKVRVECMNCCGFEMTGAAG